MGREERKEDERTRMRGAGQESRRGRGAPPLTTCARRVASRPLIGIGGAKGYVGWILRSEDRSDDDGFLFLFDEIGHDEGDVRTDEW